MSRRLALKQLCSRIFSFPIINLTCLSVMSQWILLDYLYPFFSPPPIRVHRSEAYFRNLRPPIRSPDLMHYSMSRPMPADEHRRYSDHIPERRMSGNFVLPRPSPVSRPPHPRRSEPIARPRRMDYEDSIPDYRRRSPIPQRLPSSLPRFTRDDRVRMDVEEISPRPRSRPGPRLSSDMDSMYVHTYTL